MSKVVYSSPLFPYDPPDKSLKTRVHVYTYMYIHVADAAPGRKKPHNPVHTVEQQLHVALCLEDPKEKGDYCRQPWTFDGYSVVMNRPQASSLSNHGYMYVLLISLQSFGFPDSCGVL